jgi:hypothetical protein
MCGVWQKAFFEEQDGVQGPQQFYLLFTFMGIALNTLIPPCLVSSACDGLKEVLLNRQEEASKDPKREKEFQALENVINYTLHKECGYMIFEHILISWGNLKTSCATR